MANLDELHKKLDSILEKLERIKVLQAETQEVIDSLQTRAAELQRADRPSEQKCPSCDGKGELSDLYSSLTLSCKLCKGTGILNRSAGG